MKLQRELNQIMTLVDDLFQTLIL